MAKNDEPIDTWFEKWKARATSTNRVEYWAQSRRTQHLVIPIKFLGSNKFVPTDLASIKEEKRFCVWRKDVGLFDEYEIPWKPYYAKCQISAWRGTAAFADGLVEVPMKQ